MKPNLYILTLEPIEQRYTKQWYSYWEKEFSKSFKVEYIDGNPFVDDTIDKGKFLDINKTNMWKAHQINSVAIDFHNNKIKDGDRFIFMDGWHYGITALRYMAQLQNIDIKIYTYLHAGSWDKHDFISQAGLGKWARYNELGWLKACDGHFVATSFHKKLIIKAFPRSGAKFHVVGFPMDWEKEIKTQLGNYECKKENLIVFPHRIDKEKQPEIFDKLAKKLPEYKFVKTLDVTKNKKEYYELLSKAKIVFSASLQETFGIGTVEAMMFDCFPIVPDRLSYKELYSPIFRYKDIENVETMLYNFIENYDGSIYKSYLMINKEKIKNDSLKAISKMAKVMLDE